MEKIFHLMAVVTLPLVCFTYCEEVRLTGFKGSPVNAGRVEVYHNEEWGTVCDDWWDTENAKVVCRQLGFSGAVTKLDGSKVPNGAGKIWLDDVRCSGTEETLTNCSYNGWDGSDCNHAEDAGVVCQPATRFPKPHSVEGPLQVYLNEKWYSICNGSWDMVAANVACRELGFQEAFKVVQYNGDGSLISSTFALDNIECDGNEKRLKDCRYKNLGSAGCGSKKYAGVMCKAASSVVRLRDGTVPDSGKVEVYYKGRWQAICAGENWNLASGGVVCRQLGYPEVISVTTYWSNHSVDVLDHGLSCEGNEATISECFSCKQKTSCKKHAGVRCQAVTRLNGFNSSNSGRLDVFMKGKWGTVCKTAWDEESGKVACRELGFPGLHMLLPASEFVPRGTGQIVYDSVACRGSEAKLAHCLTDFYGAKCSHDDDMGVACKKGIRLATLNNSAEGRVEVFVNGEWGSIEARSWSKRETRVVCRELGFDDAVDILDPTLVPQGSGMVWSMQGNCTGTEPRLTQCLLVTSKTRVNSTGRQVGVRCKPVSSFIRLSGGKWAHGRVEVRIHGEWGSICSSWYEKAPQTQVACKQLGFPGYVKATNTIPGYGVIWLSYVRCTGTENSLVDCRHFTQISPRMCQHDDDMTIQCQSDVRLVDTHNAIFEGKVELYSNGEWRKVCDDGSWDENASSVLCRSIGLKATGAISKSAVIMERLSRFVGNISCKGTEDTLKKCLAPNSYSTECPQNRTIEIKCEQNVRLVGEELGLNSGRLEIFSGNQWVAVSKRYWNANEGEVACRQLGYAGILGTHATPWIAGLQAVELRCDGDETVTSDCRVSPSNANNPTDELISVVCQPGVRLQGGPNDLEGRVELARNGEWRTVCGRRWTQREADIVCRTLGYGKSLKLQYISEYVPKTWSTNITCTGAERTLSKCDHRMLNDNCSSAQYPFIKCELKGTQPAMRLVDHRVEVLHYGIWGAVCSYDWDINDATVFCRSLGLPGAVAALQDSVFNRAGIIWFSSLKCTGNESSFHECSHAGIRKHGCSYGTHARAICVQNVRLVGQSNNEGRLEVYHDNVWGPFCGENWDEKASSILCHQLGYPGHHDFHMLSTSTGRVSWSTSLSCNGTEHSLSNCENNGWKKDSCLTGKQVHIQCNKVNPTVRIVGGSSAREGVVELNYNGSWGAICSDNWGRDEATVVCRQLGYGEAIWGRYDKIYKMEALIFWKTNLNCSGTEENIVECQRSKVELGKCRRRASLKCYPAIRLHHTTIPSEGLVQFYHNRTWLPVCNELWDHTSGSVCCRHMGYPDILNISSSPQGADNPQGEDNLQGLWVKLSCTGQEEKVVDCKREITTSCHQNEQATLKCNPGIRLIGAKTANEGQVVVLSNGTWGSVCNHYVDMINAGVICKELGYVGVVDKKVVTEDVNDMPILIKQLHCSQDDYFWQCSHYSFDGGNCDRRDNVKVACVSVTLQDSMASNEGRVDIFRNGTWGTCCSEKWSKQAGDVTCRELGYSGILDTVRNYIKPINDLKVRYDDISCVGSESSLLSCRHSVWRNQSCTPDNPVGLVCEPGIRLVDQNFPHEGLLEVFSEGRWSTVCDDNWDQNFMNVRVACRQLGFPDGLSSTTVSYKRHRKNTSPISMDNVDCNGDEDNLLLCRHLRGNYNDCFKPEDIRITCKTDFPAAPKILVSQNASDEAFSFVIQPPKYPGHLKKIYLYSKVLMSDKDETVHTAESRHAYPGHSRYLRIQVTGYYFLYSISISVENDMGEGSRTHMQVRTSENVPSSPRNLKLVRSDNTVALAWTKAEQPNGIILGYNVYWEEKERKIMRGKVSIFDPDITKYQLTNLNFNSSYLVGISAYTSKGEGEKTSAFVTTEMKKEVVTHTTSSTEQGSAKETRKANTWYIPVITIIAVLMIIMLLLALVLRTRVLQRLRNAVSRGETEGENVTYEVNAFDNKAFSNESTL